MIQLQNEFLQARFNNSGAELCSLKNKEGLEYIWTADPAIWPRHAPVLFPIVGRLKNDQYEFEGRSYGLSQHGFARDREFCCVFQSATEVHFELKSDAESLAKYPFHFVFQIRYTLKERELITSYHLENTGQNVMLFSIGAHPGFRCPLLENESMEDYYLSFEKSQLRRTLLTNGLLGTMQEDLTLEDGRLPLSHSLFDADALVFADGQVQKVWLRSSKNAQAVGLTCVDWPWFGIWSKKGTAPFICLEPWMGITDSADANGIFEKKDGIMKLVPSGHFSCSFSLHFH